MTVGERRDGFATLDASSVKMPDEATDMQRVTRRPASFLVNVHVPPVVEETTSIACRGLYSARHDLPGPYSAS